MVNYEIGDTVKVINSGESYTTYERLFRELGFKNTRKNSSAGFDNHDDNKVYTGVIFVIDHEDELMGLNLMDGKQCLIHFDGVKLIKSNIGWKW